MISGIFTSEITGQNEDGTPKFDRAVDEEFLSAYLGAYTSNGVYPETANSLKVTAGTGLNIAVQPGKCWVNGKFGYIDKAETLMLNTAGDTNRTDSVVIRLDLINRTMEPVIKNNSTTLQRDSDIWEIMLAKVTVKAGAQQISSADITDTRGDSTLCGYVYNRLQEIDTTDLFAQYDAAFKQWFESIQGILDEDAAGNLYNMINPLLDGAGTLNMDALPVGTVWPWWNDNLPSEKWVFGNTDIPEKNIKARNIWGTKTPNTPGRIIVDKSSDEEFNTIGKTGGEISAELYAAIGATNGDIASIGYSARKPIKGIDSYTYAIRVGSNAPVDPVNHSTVVLQPDGTDPSRLQPYIVARYIYKIK